MYVYDLNNYYSRNYSNNTNVGLRRAHYNHL